MSYRDRARHYRTKKGGARYRRKRDANINKMRRTYFKGKHWFFEDAEKLEEPETPAWGLLPEKEIYSGKSAYQSIEIFESEGYGKILALDGMVQLSTRHEFVYHEMLVHPAALSHNDPKRVLIIGGGDGGSLREIAKYPVEQILLVDIDNDVIEVSKKYLPSVSQGAFDDPRVTIINDDALSVINRYPNTFDLIVSDVTDAYGPSQTLWSRSFYRLVLEALQDNGIASFQSGYFKEQFARNGRKDIRKTFPFSVTFRAYVGCYPHDECAFLAASKRTDIARMTYEQISKKFDELKIKTEYYSPDIHFSAAVIPKSCQDE
jgi:spermidine synthase